MAFTDSDAGYEADVDCLNTSPRRTIQSLEVMEDPLGLRLVKRRRGLFRRTRPKSLEIRQGRLQPPQAPPPEEVPPVVVPPVSEPVPEPTSVPVATPPESTLPATSSPVVIPEEESDSSSSSDGEDSPSPTSSTFPPDATTLPSGSQTGVGAPSATDSLTSRPVAQDEGIDLSRQAQDPTLGIVFGSIGAGAIVICAICGVWFLCWYRRRKRMSKAVPSSNPPDTNSYMAQGNMPPDRGPPRRSPSSLMDELMTAAYDVENGAPAEEQTQAPYGYLNEKRYDPSQQLPILQPAPVVQPSVRWSIASWVRRHNPLKLNPVNGRNSVYSTTSGGGVPADPSAPPVPAVPAAFQSRGPSAEDDRVPLVPPPLAVQRVASSHYSDNGQSPVSAYARNSGTWFQRHLAPTKSQPQPQPQQQYRFNGRAVSVAMTEQTTSNMSESTWASWGAGVNRPQQQVQQQQQPHTPRRAWIEKCVKLGGWK